MSVFLLTTRETQKQKQKKLHNLLHRDDESSRNLCILMFWQEAERLKLYPPSSVLAIIGAQLGLGISLSYSSYSLHWTQNSFLGFFQLLI